MEIKTDVKMKMRPIKAFQAFKGRSNFVQVRLRTHFAA